MGSAASRVSLPPLENRVNKCIKFYRLKEMDVKRFYYLFTRLDKNLSGLIDIADFFKFLHEPRSLIGDTIFELVDCRNATAITFTEFFYAVLTYCFFEGEEVMIALRFNIINDNRKIVRLLDIYDKENRLVVKITSNGGFLDLEKRKIVEPPKKILDTCLKYLRE